MIDRIKLILEYYNLSPASFSEQIGINRSNLTHLFSGRNQPSLELAKKILHCYPDIKTEWLIMGVGEMFRSNEDKELNRNLQNDKKKQAEIPEPDLFSSTTLLSKNSTSGESYVAKQTNSSTQIINSREVEIIDHPTAEKIIENPPPSSHPLHHVAKIVFFYSDNSFEIFYQK